MYKKVVPIKQIKKPKNGDKESKSFKEISKQIRRKKRLAKRDKETSLLSQLGQKKATKNKAIQAAPKTKPTPMLTIKQRKINKLKNNPKVFFQDSQYKALRILQIFFKERT